MSESAAHTDRTMELIGEAVELGRRGDPGSARRNLIAIWEQIGVAGDPFHRCTLAHYLADVCDTPAEALIWDVRALDAADALSDERAQQHHEALRVAGFYPSLHLNIADNLRRLGAFDAAADHIDRAAGSTSALSEDTYSDVVRTAIAEVRQAIRQRSTIRRESAPGMGE